MSDENDIRSSIAAAYDELAEQPGSDLPPPDEMVDPPTEGRVRDTQGRFASKGSNESADDDKDAPSPAEPKAAKPAGQSDERDLVPEKADQAGAENPDRVAAPPQRVGAATKAAWAELPETIRKEIWDREERMDRGMARYAGLAEYAVEAEKSGQTLKEVMAAYTAAEERLISNPVATLAEFCKMTNTHPLQVAQFLGLPVAGHNPAQPQSAPQGYQQPVSSDPRVDQLIRWQQELAQREQAREAQMVTTEVERFLGDTKRFPYAENVRVVMGKLLDAGMANSLEDAYQQAIYLDPTVRALVEEESFKSRMGSVQQQQSARSARAVVQEAKRSSGSLSGSPVAGGKSTSGNANGSKSVADSLRDAYESLAG